MYLLQLALLSFWFQFVTMQIVYWHLICLHLFQIPKLPDIDPLLQNNALLASSVMDRAPINELAGWLCIIDWPKYTETTWLLLLCRRNASRVQHETLIPTFHWLSDPWMWHRTYYVCWFILCLHQGSCFQESPRQNIAHEKDL